jgi:hypothetical protein
MKHILLLVLLSPLSAYANWNGDWVGKGVAAKPNKPAQSCREILLRLEENARQLKVIEGHYICGQMHASFDPAVMDIRGAELFYKGARIGSLTREEIRLDAAFEDGSTYSLSFRRKGLNSAEYNERWTEEGQTAFKVDGILRRQK